jgi:single-strand DNA-binding protein
MLNEAFVSGVARRHSMNNLNSVLVEGNLVRDPVFKTTVKGTAVCTFSIASNRSYKNGEAGEFVKEVSYFEVETWAKLAEAVRDHGQKGRGARVVGRLKQDRWTDADGKMHSRVAIIAEHVEFRPLPKDAAAAAVASTKPNAVEQVKAEHQAAVPF